MKVFILHDSGMQTSASPASGDGPDVIEVPDAEWQQFQAIEQQYHEFLMRFSDALAKRHADDEAELEALRKRVATIESRLGVATPKSPPPKPPRAPSPLDETDAGNGVSEIETAVSAQQFRGELQALRAKNVARRRRRGLEH